MYFENTFLIPLVYRINELLESASQKLLVSLVIFNNKEC